MRLASRQAFSRQKTGAALVNIAPPAERGGCTKLLHWTPRKEVQKVNQSQIRDEFSKHVQQKPV